VGSEQHRAFLKAPAGGQGGHHGGPLVIDRNRLEGAAQGPQEHLEAMAGHGDGDDDGEACACRLKRSTSADIRPSDERPVLAHCFKPGLQVN